MNNQYDGGEAIVAAFESLGIEYIFSSPGSEWGPVWEALLRRQLANEKGPVYFDCWHEMLAVNMAVGFTQMTGRMQAVMLHSASGLLQGSMGVHCALFTETPMLITSGESFSYGEDANFDPGAHWYASLSVVGGTHQLLKPLVKWTGHGVSVHTIHETMIRAGEMAQRTPMGPVYVSVPIESMIEQWTPPKKSRKVAAAPRTRPLDQDIERVADALLAARNPVISTDDVGRDPKAFEALVALSDLLAIPVTQGLDPNFANFPRSHPMSLDGGLGSFRKDADLVLLVASRVPWYPPGDGPEKAKVIAISENPLKGQVVYQNLQIDEYLEGNLAESLTALVAALRARRIDTNEIEKRRSKWRAEHDRQDLQKREAAAKARSAASIDPVSLIAALNGAMPQDAVYVDETVRHSGLIKQHLIWNRPQSYFRPAAGLGQGFGVALGVKLAEPKRPVVLLIGDGSFLYNPVLAGLGTAKNRNLPILVVVFNNKAYEAMRVHHTRYYPNGLAATSKSYLGVNIDGPDYAELGKPFGFDGRKVQAPDELASALKQGVAALERGRTFILNVELAA